MPTSPYFSGINLVKPLEQKVTELNAHTDQTVQTFYENILKREDFLNNIHVYNMYREIHVHVQMTEHILAVNSLIVYNPITVLSDREISREAITLLLTWRDSKLLLVDM